MLPKTLALVSTVLLLMSLAFFVLGATPLLILKHDVPMDSRVIRQFFHYGYCLVVALAAAACLGHALAGQWPMAAFLGFVAAMAVVVRRWMLSRLDVLRSTMQDGDAQAIRRFRKLHVGGITLNLTQFAAVVWAIAQVKL